jgi:hypothetical protein
MGDELVCCLCEKKISFQDMVLCDHGYVCKSCKNNCPANCQPCPIEMKELEAFGEVF